MEASRGSPVYLDLAYLPSGGSASLVDEEFFRRVRSLCYVISGQGQHKEEGMRAVLDALLAGKQQWDRDLQVCDHPRASDSLGTGWGQRLLVELTQRREWVPQIQLYFQGHEERRANAGILPALRNLFLSCPFPRPFAAAWARMLGGAGLFTFPDPWLLTALLSYELSRRNKWGMWHLHS